LEMELDSSRRQLMGSLWNREKLIPITDWHL
jgi:hypothetical protein